MKKVLIVSFYFPPDGYAGGLRATKFAKYLPENGWMPVVLTSKSPHLERDDSLFDELPGDLKIFRTPSPDHDMFLRFLRKSRKDVLKGDLNPRKMVKIESFFLLPDTKALWFYTSILKVLEIIRSEGIKVIFSTSPPITSHLIAVVAGKISGVPVILDYRDAWYEDPFGFFPTKVHRILVKHIEKIILKNANSVTAINEVILSGRLNLANIKGIVLPHGFDPEDFVKIMPMPDTERLRLAYAGSITYITNPIQLIRAFMELDLPDVELHFYSTPVHRLVELTSACNRIKWHDFLPHREIVKVLPEHHAFVATIDREVKSPYVSVSKIFDYIGAGRPILGIAPRETYLWKFLSKFDFSYLADSSSVDEIKRTLLKLYRDWKENKLKPIPEDIRKKFNRREQARQLAKIFDEVIG